MKPPKKYLTVKSATVDMIINLLNTALVNTIPDYMFEYSSLYSKLETLRKEITIEHSYQSLRKEKRIYTKVLDKWAKMIPELQQQLWTCNTLAYSGGITPDSLKTNLRQVLAKLEDIT